MHEVIGVVDDDASILRAVQRLLGSLGFTVKTFASGEDLLASACLARIHCLVLDVHLGGLSGFELQERLSEAPVQIPIIFITAHDDPPTARARSPGRRRGVPSQALRRARADQRHRQGPGPQLKPPP